jgi:hypothetical protein
MLEFLIDNIFAIFGGRVFHQTVGEDTKVVIRPHNSKDRQSMTKLKEQRNKQCSTHHYTGNKYLSKRTTLKYFVFKMLNESFEERGYSNFRSYITTGLLPM